MHINDFTLGDQILLCNAERAMMIYALVRPDYFKSDKLCLIALAADINAVQAMDTVHYQLVQIRFIEGL